MAAGRSGCCCSRSYVQPGVPEVTDYYDHYSLLASIEDSFGFKHLGYASASQLPVFGAGVWTAFSG